MKTKLLVIVSSCTLLLLMLASLCVGEVSVSFYDAISTLFSGSDNVLIDTVILDMRLPRVLLAAIVGGGLAAAGTVMQNVFRNPLVEPGIIGVSTGSALSAVIFIVLVQSSSLYYYEVFGLLGLPIFTFVGALIATTVVYRIASNSMTTNVTYLILAGVAINSLCMAATGLILYFADNSALREFTFWSFGSFANASWNNVFMIIVLIIIPSTLLIAMSRALNLFALGEEQMNYLGFNSKSIKRNAIILCSIIVGGAVAAVGVVGFIGLIVPHMIRIILGPDCKRLLPISILIGALLTVFADLVSKGLLSDLVFVVSGKQVLEGIELPVGMITALMGAPFFVFLLLRAKRRGGW